MIRDPELETICVQSGGHCEGGGSTVAHCVR